MRWRWPTPAGLYGFGQQFRAGILWYVWRSVPYRDLNWHSKGSTGHPCWRAAVQSTRVGPPAWGSFGGYMVNWIGHADRSVFGCLGSRMPRQSRPCGVTRRETDHPPTGIWKMGGRKVLFRTRSDSNPVTAPICAHQPTGATPGPECAWRTWLPLSDRRGPVACSALQLTNGRRDRPGWCFFPDERTTGSGRTGARGGLVPCGCWNSTDRHLRSRLSPRSSIDPARVCRRVSACACSSASWPNSSGRWPIGSAKTAGINRPDSARWPAPAFHPDPGAGQLFERAGVVLLAGWAGAKLPAVGPSATAPAAGRARLSK